MVDEKLVGSEEIAVTGSDGKIHKSGALRPPGAVPIDGVVGESDIPMPLSVDLGDEGIVTLSPNAIPEATNRDHKNKLIWTATYTDGSVISEYDENGKAVSSEDIDHKALREFRLLDNKGRTVIAQAIQPGQCFFYRRRTALRTGDDVIEVIHIFGWRMFVILSINQEMEIEKEWITHAIFLFESDMHVEVGYFKAPSDDLSESKQWKYDPNWRDIDEVAAE